MKKKGFRTRYKGQFTHFLLNITVKICIAGTLVKSLLSLHTIHYVQFQSPWAHIINAFNTNVVLMILNGSGLREVNYVFSVISNLMIPFRLCSWRYTGHLSTKMKKNMYGRE